MTNRSSCNRSLVRYNETIISHIFFIQDSDIEWTNKDNENKRYIYTDFYYYHALSIHFTFTYYNQNSLEKTIIVIGPMVVLI